MGGGEMKKWQGSRGLFLAFGGAMGGVEKRNGGGA
jgi:hypothetical protein